MVSTEKPPDIIHYVTRTSREMGLHSGLHHMGWWGHSKWLLLWHWDPNHALGRTGYVIWSPAQNENAGPLAQKLRRISRCWEWHVKPQHRSFWVWCPIGLSRFHPTKLDPALRVSVALPTQMSLRVPHSYYINIQHPRFLRAAQVSLRVWDGRKSQVDVIPRALYIFPLLGARHPIKVRFLEKFLG